MILQALIEMQHGDESDKANLKSIYGMLFFGVPSQGMSIESLVPMVENQPNRFFLESLSKVTDGLRAQRQNFRQVFPFKDSRVISFYETKQSPTAQKVSQASFASKGLSIECTTENQRWLGDERAASCLGGPTFRDARSRVGI
jgi:hypothetical protein